MSLMLMTSILLFCCRLKVLAVVAVSMIFDYLVLFPNFPTYVRRIKIIMIQLEIMYVRSYFNELQLRKVATVNQRT